MSSIFSVIKKLVVILMLLWMLPGCAPKMASQNKAYKKQVLTTVTLANKYFMDKWPDAGKEIFVPAKKRTWPGNIWTRAVYYEGLLALYRVDPQPAYYNYAVSWGDKHNWGLRNGIKTRNADDQACGQTYINLYLIDKKEERIKDIKTSVDLMMQTGKIDDWSWIDAIQMAMPVFTQLGIIYNDTNYFHRMYEMYAYTKYQHGDHGLYNAADGLWWRDKDFDPPYQAPNGKSCYWSRGNGWVVAALVRVLNSLPKTDPHWEEYMDDYQAMMKALPAIQRTDGYWNVSLLDESNFGGKELTGTSLFVYGMAWGINNGYLGKPAYLPVIKKAWDAMSKECVHPNGFLGYVQGNGKEPKDSQPVKYDAKPDFEDVGLGCFLLAGSEVLKIQP